MVRDENLLVTVVTVCYNAEKFIAKTMKSVLEQTYENIEYIIKDGESTDRTNEIVESYRERFEQKGISFVHIIRKDNGIYDAMNQATDIATGEYINYMNADDIFFDGNVLTDVFESGQTADLLYGDAVCQYEYVKGKKAYTIWEGQHESFENTPFSHQACFFKTDVIKDYHYSEKYRIAADFHVISKFFVDKKTFCNVGRIISICTMDGVSNTQMEASYREAVQVKKELGMEEFLAYDTKLSLQVVRIKQWILVNMPDRIVWYLIAFQMKRRGKHIYRNLGEVEDGRKKDI